MKTPIRKIVSRWVIPKWKTAKRKTGQTPPEPEASPSANRNRWQDNQCHRPTYGYCCKNSVAASPAPMAHKSLGSKGSKNIDKIDFEIARCRSGEFQLFRTLEKIAVFIRAGGARFLSERVFHHIIGGFWSFYHLKTIAYRFLQGESFFSNSRNCEA